MSHTPMLNSSDKEIWGIQSTWKAGCWNELMSYTIKSMKNLTQTNSAFDIKLAYICISSVFDDRTWINTQNIAIFHSYLKMWPIQLNTQTEHEKRMFLYTCFLQNNCQEFVFRIFRMKKTLLKVWKIPLQWRWKTRCKSMHYKFETVYFWNRTKKWPHKNACLG